MNKVMMMGRLTRDPEIRYGGANNTCVARFALAVDRRFKREGQASADFFDCVAFGKLGEFVEKYLKKGTKIVLEGELQNNNYQNKEGQTVYGYRIVASGLEFAESKSASAHSNASTGSQTNAAAAGSTSSNGEGAHDVDGFMSIPDAEQEELPFY